MDQRSYARLGTTARSSPVNNREILFPNGYDRNENSSRPLVVVRDTAEEDAEDFGTSDGFESHSPSENVTVTIKIGSGGQGIVTETDKRNMLTREDVCYTPVNKKLHEKSNQKDDLADMRQKLLGIENVEGEDREEEETDDLAKRQSKTGAVGHMSEFKEQHSKVRKQEVRRQNSLYDEYKQFLAPESIGCSQSHGTRSKDPSVKPKVTIVRSNSESAFLDRQQPYVDEQADEGEDFMAYLKELRAESHVGKTSLQEDDGNVQDFLKCFQKQTPRSKEKDRKRTEQALSDDRGHLTVESICETRTVDLTTDSPGAFRTSNPVAEDIITISDDDDQFFDVEEEPECGGITIEEITISDDNECQNGLSTFDFNLLSGSKNQMGGNGIVTENLDSEEDIPYPGDEVIVVHKAVIRKKNSTKYENEEINRSSDESDSESEKEDENDEPENSKSHKNSRKKDRDDSSDDEDQNDTNESDKHDDGQGDGDKDSFDDGNNERGYDRDGNRDGSPEHSDNEENTGRENEGYFSPGLRSRSSTDQENTSDFNCNSQHNGSEEQEKDGDLETVVKACDGEGSNTETLLALCCSKQTCNQASEKIIDTIVSLRTLNDSKNDHLHQCSYPHGILNTQNKHKHVTILPVGELSSFGSPCVYMNSESNKPSSLKDNNRASDAFENDAKLGISEGTKEVALQTNTVQCNKSLKLDSASITCSSESFVFEQPDEFPTYGIVETSSSPEYYGSLEGATGISTELKGAFALDSEPHFTPEDKEVFEILDLTECLNNVECHFQTIDNYEVQEYDSDTDIPVSTFTTDSQTDYEEEPVFDILSPPEAFKDNSKPPAIDLQLCNVIKDISDDVDIDVKDWTSEDVLSSSLFRCNSSETESRHTASSFLGEEEAILLSDFSSSSSCCSSVDYEKEFENAIETSNDANVVSESSSTDESTEKTNTGILMEYTNKSKENEEQAINVRAKNKTQGVVDPINIQQTAAGEYQENMPNNLGCETIKAERRDCEYEKLDINLGTENYIANVIQENKRTNKETLDVLSKELKSICESEEDYDVVSVNLTKENKENTPKLHFDADRDIAEDTIVNKDELVCEECQHSSHNEQEPACKNLPCGDICKQIKEIRMNWYLDKKPRLISYFVPYFIEHLPQPKIDLKKQNCIRRICLLRKKLLCDKKVHYVNNKVPEIIDAMTDIRSFNDGLDDLKRKCEMWKNGDDNKSEDNQAEIVKLGFGFYIFGTGEKINLPVGPRLKKSNNNTEDCERNRRSHYFRGKTVLINSFLSRLHSFYSNVFPFSLGAPFFATVLQSASCFKQTWNVLGKK